MSYIRKPYLIIAIIASVITFLVFLFFYARLPEMKVPLHWNIKGEVDHYGPKSSLLILGCFPLLLVVLFYFLPRWDPRSDSYERHSKAYSVMLLCITVFSCSISLSILAVALGYKWNEPFILQILIGLLFIFMGNYLRQVRPTYFFGIRTPWALVSERNWRKTHRFGSVVMVLSGLVFLISAFIPGWDIIARIVLLGGIVLIYVYSYFEFKKNGS
jgi:uncharacterized membrane protein